MPPVAGAGPLGREDPGGPLSGAGRLHRWAPLMLAVGWPQGLGPPNVVGWLDLMLDGPNCWRLVGGWLGVSNVGGWLEVANPLLHSLK